MPDGKHAPQQGNAGSDDGLRPFIPVWTRAAALAIGALLAAGTMVLVFFVSESEPARTQFTSINVMGIVLVLSICIIFLWRLGGVRADVSISGIRVRNIIHTRKIEWVEIVNLRFTRSDAWVFADLTDGTQTAILGIQQSDGKRAQSEFRRLKSLVTRYGTSQKPR